MTRRKAEWPGEVVYLALVLGLMASGVLAQVEMEDCGRGLVVSSVSPGGAGHAAGIRSGDALVGWRFGRLAGCFCSPWDPDRVELEASSTGPVELLVRDSDGRPRVLTVAAGWWQVDLSAPLVVHRPEIEDLYLAAQVERRSGRFGSAGEFYGRAALLATPEDLTHILAARTLALLGAGDARAAVGSAAESIAAAATTAQTARGFLLQARAQAMYKDFDGARRSGELALGLQSELLPGSLAVSETHLFLGGLELATGNVRAALGHLNLAIALSNQWWRSGPLWRSAVLLRARAQLALSDRTAAEGDVLEAVAGAPGEPLPADLAPLAPQATTW